MQWLVRGSPSAATIGENGVLNLTRANLHFGFGLLVVQPASCGTLLAANFYDSSSTLKFFQQSLYVTVSREFSSNGVKGMVTFLFGVK